MTEVVIYGRATDGHRSDYYKLLDVELRQLGFVPVFTASPARVLTARRVFFAMIDENVFLFVVCALLAILPGRIAAGFLFRAGECFKTSLKYRIKYSLFRSLRMLSRVRVLTILPFAVSERFTEIASGWVYDPQLWDLQTLKGMVVDTDTPLAQDVRDHAAGRRIIVALGAQNEAKGLDYLAQIWATSREFRERFLVAVAGKVSPASEARAESMREIGAIIFNRFVTDQEMASLYKSSNVVWSAYHPAYDQASGIAGRAFQLGRATIVRRDSYVAKLMAKEGGRHIQIDFDNAPLAANAILNDKNTLDQGGRPTASVELMRNQSLKTIAEALSIR